MPKAPKDQIHKFREAARALGCDESEVTFDAALGKIARHKPKPTDEIDVDKSGTKSGKVGR